MKVDMDKVYICKTKVCVETTSGSGACKHILYLELKKSI